MTIVQVSRVVRYAGGAQTGTCTWWIDHADADLQVKRVRTHNTDAAATARLTIRSEAQGIEDSFDTPPNTDTGFLNVPGNRRYTYDDSWGMSARYLS
jgi:hypothetical protein